MRSSIDSIPFDRRQRLVVLTGAGISAESGVPTFRDNGGLWEGHRVEDVATPAGFARDPVNVWAFYAMLRRAARTLTPNPAHFALAELGRALPAGQFTLITQNVDPLHSRAGSTGVLYMHGELARVVCTRCAHDEETWDELPELPTCPRCGALLRPKITWFGEVPCCLKEIAEAMRQVDVFLVIGTSGVVYPAAGLVDLARQRRTMTICINKERPANAAAFDYVLQGAAGVLTPALVKAWLRSG